MEFAVYLLAARGIRCPYTLQYTKKSICQVTPEKKIDYIRIRMAPFLSGTIKVDVKSLQIPHEKNDFFDNHL